MPLTTTQIENLRTWITALRSGEFEQGKQRLRRSDDKFCCLGVWAEVSGDFVREEICGGYELRTTHKHHDEITQKLPISYCADKLGMDRSKQCKLMVANDKLGKTFQEIAQMLETFIETDGERLE